RPSGGRRGEAGSGRKAPAAFLSQISRRRYAFTSGPSGALRAIAPGCRAALSDSPDDRVAGSCDARLHGQGIPKGMEEKMRHSILAMALLLTAASATSLPAQEAAADPWADFVPVTDEM